MVEYGEIPAAGENAIITIKGDNCFTNDSSNGKGGDIYAGSLSDVGYQSADVPNTYKGSVSIIIEDGAKGIGEISLSKLISIITLFLYLHILSAI